MNLQSTFKQLESILYMENPQNQDFQQFEQSLQTLYPYRQEEEYQQCFLQLRKEFPSISTNQTMQGLAYAKPYGYAGDFDIIDKIYTQWHSSNPRLAVWDDYFHQQAASIAVRNRKTYFKNLLFQLLESRADEKLRVLNLASGPCRDIQEFLSENDTPNVHFDCVELDINAITYAKDLLGKHKKQVTFIHQNIFRFLPSKSYDLIWSAGLFDYFDNSVFIRILKRLLPARKKDASIVIGNFSNENPTAPYMELIGEWYLHYRSKAQLIEIAKKAGVASNQLNVEHEPEKVNLFLKIENTHDR